MDCQRNDKKTVPEFSRTDCHKGTGDDSSAGGGRTGGRADERGGRRWDGWSGGRGVERAGISVYHLCQRNMKQQSPAFTRPDSQRGTSTDSSAGGGRSGGRRVSRTGTMNDSSAGVRRSVGRADGWVASLQKSPKPMDWQRNVKQPVPKLTSPDCQNGTSNGSSATRHIPQNHKMLTPAQPTPKP